MHKDHNDTSPEERAKFASLMDEVWKGLAEDEPNVPHSRRHGIKRHGRRKSAARLKVKR